MKHFRNRLSSDYRRGTATVSYVTEALKHVAKRLQSVVSHSQPDGSVHEEELFVYHEDIRRGPVICTDMEYWFCHIDQYPSLSAVAPTSHAYTQLIFSVCAGKRNRTQAALEHRVFS